MRYAGNPVFPNGFIEIELQCVPGGVIEIRFLPGSASECRITRNGRIEKQLIPYNGLLRLETAAEKETLRIEKSGTAYPGIIAIRSLKDAGE